MKCVVLKSASVVRIRSNKNSPDKKAKGRNYHINKNFKLRSGRAIQMVLFTSGFDL